MKWVGHLSREDAGMLSALSVSCSVVEFGAGGSTMIFAQNADHVLTIDTKNEWLLKTGERLDRLDVSAKCKMINLDDFSSVITEVGSSGEYDIAFIDGERDKRLEVAHMLWPMLCDYGMMLWHDTLRPQDAKDVYDFATEHHLEVRSIVSNPVYNGLRTNLTIIHKRPAEEYHNWRYTEGKPNWFYDGNPPEEFWTTEYEWE